MKPRNKQLAHGMINISFLPITQVKIYVEINLMKKATRCVYDNTNYN